MRWPKRVWSEPCPSLAPKRGTAARGVKTPTGTLAPAAIAFDAWIANEDRTASNLLFAGRRGFLLIDHGDALPNRIREATQVPNGLAKHFVATHSGTSPFELADRIEAAAVSFGQVNFTQLRTAALLGNWEREHLFDPCVDLLTARLNRLPELIEGEFRLGQGQLLA